VAHDCAAVRAAADRRETCKGAAVLKPQIVTLVVSALVGVLTTGNVEAAAPDACHLRLAVDLTPDVPNPRDPGFLGSLLSDPLFRLTWVQSSDSGIVVELTGPGPDYRCKNAMTQLGKNTHVLQVKVVEAHARS
jgi:hypothetical protein